MLKGGTQIRKLASKAHINIYEVVELFKVEQTATEVRHEKRLLTIKGKYEVGNYTLSELVKALVVGYHFSKIIHHSHVLSLSKKKCSRQNGTFC